MKTRSRKTSLTVAPVHDARAQDDELNQWLERDQSASARDGVLLYRHMRQKTGATAMPISLRQMFREVGVGPAMGYAAIKWLETNRFITTTTDETSRTWGIAKIPQAPAKIVNRRRRGATVYSYIVRAVDAMDGTACPAEISTEEAEYLLALGLEADAMRLYWQLRVVATLNLSALSEEFGNSRRIHRLLDVLAASGLVHRFSELACVLVFPAVGSMVDVNNSIEGKSFVASHVGFVFQEFKAGPSESQKLISLFVALNYPEGSGSAFTSAIEKGAARRLTALAPYEELRPALVLFVRQPEFFLEIRDRVSRYGVTTKGELDTCA